MALGVGRGSAGLRRQRGEQVGVPLERLVQHAVLEPLVQRVPRQVQRRSVVDRHAVEGDVGGGRARGTGAHAGRQGAVRDVEDGREDHGMREVRVPAAPYDEGAHLGETGAAAPFQVLGQLPAVGAGEGRRVGAGLRGADPGQFGELGGALRVGAGEADHGQRERLVLQGRECGAVGGQQRGVEAHRVPVRPCHDGGAVGEQALASPGARGGPRVPRLRPGLLGQAGEPVPPVGAGLLGHRPGRAGQPGRDGRGTEGVGVPAQQVAGEQHDAGGCPHEQVGLTTVAGRPGARTTLRSVWAPLARARTAGGSCRRVRHGRRRRRRAFDVQDRDPRVGRSRGKHAERAVGAGAQRGLGGVTSSCQAPRSRARSRSSTWKLWWYWQPRPVWPSSRATRYACWSSRAGSGVSGAGSHRPCSSRQKRPNRASGAPGGKRPSAVSQRKSRPSSRSRIWWSRAMPEVWPTAYRSWSLTLPRRAPSRPRSSRLVKTTGSAGARSALGAQFAQHLDAADVRVGQRLPHPLVEGARGLVRVGWPAVDDEQAAGGVGADELLGGGRQPGPVGGGQDEGERFVRTGRCQGFGEGGQHQRGG
ncbi:hypothetical protein STENM36S_01681 [Streptomyces tendae]